MVSSLLVSILVIVVIIGVLTYLFWYKDKRVGTVFLYEKVGKYERFSGILPLFMIRASNTDVYKIGGSVNKTIDKPAPEDFFDTNGNQKKILHITKFSEDDYRIKQRFDESWYKKVEVQVEEATGNMVEDDNGDEVAETALVTRIVEEQYSEPLGISQEGRDAIRVGLENERMLKDELKDNTFWDKWGQPLMIVTVVLILGMTIMSTSKDNRAAIEATSQVCNDNYEVIKENIESPTFAKNLLDKVKQDEVNSNAPPK